MGPVFPRDRARVLPIVDFVSLTPSDSDVLACPACTKIAARPAFVKSGYPFRRCTECGLVFASPFPTDEQLAQYYNDPSRTPTEEHFNKAGSRRRRAALRALRFWRYVIPGRAVLDRAVHRRTLSGH